MTKYLSRKDFTRELVEHYLEGYKTLIVSVYYKGSKDLEMYKFNIYGGMDFESIERIHRIIFDDNINTVNYMYIK